jgi:hypothetical protein
LNASAWIGVLTAPFSSSFSFDNLRWDILDANIALNDLAQTLLIQPAAQRFYVLQIFLLVVVFNL